MRRVPILACLIVLAAPSAAAADSPLIDAPFAPVGARTATCLRATVTPAELALLGRAGSTDLWTVTATGAALAARLPPAEQWHCADIAGDPSGAGVIAA